MTHLLYMEQLHPKIEIDQSISSIKVSGNGEFGVSMTSGDLEYGSIWKIQNHDTPSLYGAPTYQNWNGSDEY